jgi:hypothetical protein
MKSIYSQCGFCYLLVQEVNSILRSKNNFFLWQINSASAISSFVTESSKEDIGSLETSSSKWSWINEPVGISKVGSLSKTGLLEQINTTADRSDYLWYSLR